jgi:hypothetical protein
MDTVTDSIATWREVIMPDRLARRPRDERGFPVTYVTLWVDGKPDFRTMDTARQRQAVERRRCGLCGCGLPGAGPYAFIGGDRSIQNLTFSDPAMHVDCAQYAMLVCPYLVTRGRKRVPMPHQGATPWLDPAQPARMGLLITHTWRSTLVGESYHIHAGPDHEVIWLEELRRPLAAANSENNR